MNSLSCDNLCMVGKIRTKEKCPHCNRKFEGEPLRCPMCKTAPTRYFIYLHWQGEEFKIYSGQDNYPLDSWDRAHRLLTAIRYGIDRGTFDPRDFVKKEIKHLQFQNYAQEWLARREREDLAKSYLKDLRGGAKNHFIPYFGKKSIRDIRVGDIEDFRAWLPETLNQKTVYNLLGMLHKIFKDAHRRRDILHLPDFPRIQLNEPVTKWIDEDDQKRVLAYIEDPVYRTFYYFLMKQGCRPGEARALRWEKIDFKNNIVIIDAAFDRDIFRPHTKERDTRYLPLHPGVKKALQQLFRSLNGFVFVNQFGRPLSGRRVYEHWRRAAAKAGVKATCYEGTRHSLASQAINRGVSERVVGDMLGHKNSKSTRRYAKMKAESLKQVWGEMDEMAAPGPTRPGPAPGGKVVNLTDWKTKQN